MSRHAPVSVYYQRFDRSPLGGEWSKPRLVSSLMGGEQDTVGYGSSVAPMGTCGIAKVLNRAGAGSCRSRAIGQCQRDYRGTTGRMLVSVS
ncbi:unnamed protein product [Tuber melanosporum]|uniref:(Perigord truffle) hypothetical protein n=1 Tax=Tuber melanosporum (strain Mel28) TaxID=656061 RepID=D5GJG9_TUBMM|nr:uncharacterized protein GSTUM_00008994001 [Tuber melanosporum]CAZ84662.1 unnamed protein product [Tuber melanosporum]